MKRFVSMLGLGLLIAFVVVQTATAQGPVESYPVGGGQGGVTPFSTKLPSVLPGSMWMEVNLADNGLGYEGAYGTLGAKTRLFQDYFDGRWLAEMQGHLALDNAGFFGNLGIERVFSIESAPADVAFGVFYDRDNSAKSNFNHSFDQIGISAAVRTRKFDVRANGYFPIGTSDHQEGGLGGGKGFIGNNFALISGIDSALQGFDTELRLRPYWLTMLNGTVDLGGYYYESDSVDSFGGARARFGFQAWRGGLVSLEVNHDDRFETTANLQLAWRFGGSGSAGGHEYSVIGRDMEPTIRNDHITRFNQETVLAVNPATGTPYNFLHVDNSTGVGGTGAVDNRFRTLAQAERFSGANDVIFVYEGDGTSTGYEGGIVLQDGQFLLGDGVEHRLSVGGGRFTLLCNDTDGIRPTLVNDGGDIVTLANNNTVAGLVLDGEDPANSGVVGTNITGPTVIRDNNIINMLVDGIRINGLDGDLLVQNNRFDNITDDAVEISNYNSTGRTVAFDANRIVEAGDNGIILQTFNAENSIAFTSNVITNAGTLSAGLRSGDGIAIINGFDSIVGTGGLITIANNRVLDTARHGINITDVRDPEAVFNFTTNTVRRSGGDSLLFSNSLGDLNFDGGVFAGSGGSGFRYDVNGGGTSRINLRNLDISGANIGAVFNASNATNLIVTLRNSTIDGNVSHGVQMNALDPGSAIRLNSFANNNVTNNGGRGLEINGSEDTIIRGTVLNNLFQNNVQGGLVAESIGGDLEMVIGGVAAPLGTKPDNPQNLFDGNGGVGAGIVLRGDAAGHVNIDDNIFINQVDDPNSAIFNGDGVHVRLAGVDALPNSTAVLRDDPVLGPSTISGNIIGSLTDATVGNANNGITIHAEDETIIEALNVQGNEIGNNGNDGINAVARDSANINNLLVSANVIDSNSGDGIDASSTESARFISVNPAGIRNNTITNNTVNGILLQLSADAQMTLDIAENLIDGNGFSDLDGDGVADDPNGGSGIATTETVGSAQDTRFISGLWSENMISNNGGHGISSNAATAGLIVDANMIESNSLYGVTIPSAGSATYSNNLIARNGVNGATRGNVSGGINIFGAGVKNLDLQDNLIFDNVGDGLRIVQNSILSFTINAEGNTIESNTGRGVSILNQGDGSFLNVTLRENKIASNEQEGIFVMNTSSASQSIDQNINPVFNGTALNADGLVDDFTRMTLVIDNNRIINNGSANPNLATGLVIMVGTNDGGRGFTDDGGFFEDGRGGIGATVTDNIFSGNLGDDLFIRSFVSTVNPITTVSSDGWEDQNDDPRDPTNDIFDIDDYESDPLARLDLLWRGNTYDSIFVSGGAAAETYGAFYNDADGVFKSRLDEPFGGNDDDTDGGLDDNGPFEFDIRPRNAQRLAARNVNIGGTQLPPNLTIGASDSYLFPGMGQSTFRLLTTSDPTDFITDNFYVDFFDANGLLLVDQFDGINEMPYGWNFLGGNPRPQ